MEKWKTPHLFFVCLVSAAIEATKQRDWEWQLQCSHSAIFSQSPIPNNSAFRLRAMAPHSSPLELNHFAEVGNKVADAAGEIIRKYFRKNFDVIHKHDLSNFIFIPFHFV